jgi:hypothetical protein
MILFLDYDGVLHPNEVYRVPGKGIVLKMDGHELFEWAELLADTLDDHQDVRIVLSTSWVWTIGFDKSKSRLPVRLRERVIGSNWHSSMNQRDWKLMSRFDQISVYVNRHRLGNNWLAIDDDNYEWPINMKHHLIHTHEHDALGNTPGAIEKLKYKLSTRLLE